MDVYAVLADPTRRRIIELLSDRVRTAGEIADRFPTSRPAVSRHLRVLRESGVITSVRDAQHRVYTLNPGALDDVAAWIARYQPFWDERLEALAARSEALEKEHA